MAEISLTKTRMFEGVWEGVITGIKDKPQITVTHQGRQLQGVVVEQAGDEFVLRVTVPAELISDGVQTFVIQNAADGATLGSFAILSGDALAEDIRAEVELLRAELDLLKRAFRRHCVETA